MNVTFVASFRNREFERVKKSLDSLQRQSCHDFQMIFVDYGSTKEYSIPVQELLSNYSFCKYYYSDTRGWLWNRSLALNTGAKLATTQYIFFTDVDIVYDINFVERMISKMSTNVFLISDCVRVPKGFRDWEKIINGSYRGNFKSMMGKGIACCAKEVFNEIGGFDEQFAFWGKEDIDLSQRMKRYGIEEVVADDLLSYHQWHPRTLGDASNSVLFHNVTHHYNNMRENAIYRNQHHEWGKLITQRDRPIFKFVDPTKNYLKISELIHFRDAYDYYGLIRWAMELETSKNTVWAVSRNKKIGNLTKLLNKVLCKFNWKLDHSISFLDDFAQGLIFSVPGFFIDYYLDCALYKNRYSIFML